MNSLEDMQILGQKCLVVNGYFRIGLLFTFVNRDVTASYTSSGQGPLTVLRSHKVMKREEKLVPCSKLDSLGNQSPGPGVSMSNDL